MSSPIASAPDRDQRDPPESSVAHPTSVLALSGLLKVQRRWLLASRADPELEAPAEPDEKAAPAHSADGTAGGAAGTAGGADGTAGGADGTDSAAESPAPDRLSASIEPGPGGQASLVPPPRPGGRARLPVHLEDSEWSRVALGVAAEALRSLGMGVAPELLQLDPDAITVHLPTSEPPPWPFDQGRTAQSWRLPRDSRVIAALPVTPALASASRKAALVTLSENNGRRVLVDLVAVGSTILKGAPHEVGVKIADVAVELGGRRWSDLENLILVAFDRRMPHIEGARYAPDVAAALDDLTVRSMSGPAPTSICVVLPPWASDPADPVLAELVRFCEQTDGAGILCCASAEGALCLWELVEETTGLPALTFGDGRRLPAPELVGTRVYAPFASSRKLRQSLPGSDEGDHETRPIAPQILPLEVAVLGSVQINGAPESFRYRRRLTELVTFLAMHPEGATTDSFATALWPERRVPLQTLANRLSEARRALGFASDGRPRLRKQGKRHLIVEAETDWDRFRDLASEGCGADSWRRALALVRGRPFDGLDRGEWAQLEGYVAAVEASVVGVA
ncbi:MAG TPA: hypothetical protein VK217_13075, partial [Acidimicrobiales bacterium]|nr:hypothetical protein [Acidimicrobiales bacterium]